MQSVMWLMLLDEAAIAENTPPNSHPIKQLKFNLKPLNQRDRLALNNEVTQQ
ncbi:hypothetical protein [Methylobacter sp.]|jgi:hypothetical protein|uniref:hypothetical protein n=1 Tax=Methylobacter sp. TaxID=2051955 RepID=UPI00260159AF|nr:hypothetical protein [Methylobacter sp.]